MSDDGQRGGDAQCRRGEEGGGDDHAIDEIVKGVAQQNQRPTFMAVDDTVFIVAMAPDDQLLQHEKGYDAGECRTGDGDWHGLFQRFGSMPRNAAPNSVPMA